MTSTRLLLSAGLDRSLARAAGGSVRYLIAEVSAEGAASAPSAPLDLGLAIDVSGSMSGGKLAAAQRAARGLCAAMSPRDRLSVVAFDNRVEVLLHGRTMDDEGRDAADRAIAALHPRGGTALFDGWLATAERVARTMADAPDASPRVLLLSDGHANDGLCDRGEIAVHVGALLERGVVTSTLGVGDGYDERLLGAMAEAGGGSLHDAAGGGEIAEVVMGELQEGRSALVERATLRVALPPQLRAEVVGAFAHRMLPGAIEVTVGSLLPGQSKRVVLRLFCPAGAPGSELAIGLSADAVLPAGGLAIEARPVDAVVRLVGERENELQPRDLARCLAAANAFQAEILRDTMARVRDGDHAGARRHVERALRRLERLARGVPGAERLLDEAAIVRRSIDENWDERTRKEAYLMGTKFSRGERDRRAGPRGSLSDIVPPRR
jgi:Ca-activated chloride channel family protein